MTMKIEIPDGLCDFMLQRFGGNLRAPQAGNECGHLRDSHFKLLLNDPITDHAIWEAVESFYKQVPGITVSDDGDTCYSLLQNGTLVFRIVVSNCGERILVNAGTSL